MTGTKQLLTDKRLRFISIVCVIALLVNGISLFKNAQTYCYPRDQAKLLMDGIAQEKQMVPYLSADTSLKQSFMQMLDKFVDNCTPFVVRQLSMYTFFGSFICILGVSLIWKLKKRGFYFFLAGTLLGILAPYILFGCTFFSAVIAIFTSFFWFIFIILFAVNLKYMD
ncbi:MAG TPA: hypothetical protein VK559_11660 [Ferruginibacter sp.]|nr:hypothetical protein [Ferruginibacter sp.]